MKRWMIMKAEEQKKRYHLLVRSRGEIQLALIATSGLSTPAH
jgi:hypothetical protein